MGKRSDKGDSTQPLSESQVVEVAPPKPPIAKHDQSVAWKGTVVSADEFALPKAPGGGRARWVIVGVLGAGVVGGGAYVLWPSAKPAAVKSDAAAGSAVVMPVIAADAAGSDAAPPDAAVADAAEVPDAAVDAGVRPDAGTPNKKAIPTKVKPKKKGPAKKPAH